MGKNRTTALLDALSKSELTLLGKFLKSQFFTAKEFLDDTFTVLRAMKQKAVEKPERAFARVFPGEPFDRHRWNKALSDLNGHIEDFLAVCQLRTDPNLRAQADINAFFMRNDENLFRHTIDTALKNLPGNGTKETPEVWQLRFWALKRSAAFGLANPQTSADKLINDLGESIDLYYFISKLQLACNHVSSAQVLRLKNDPAVFRQLLEQTERLDQSGKSALLTLYRALLHLLTAQDAQFEPFFALLQHQGPRLDRAELETVVRLALNYCIQRYRAGGTDAFEQYRRVFGWTVEQKAWTAAGYAEETFLNNGVMFAKSHDAAGFEAFLESGKNTLPAERRDKTLVLLRAYWHFYQADFRTAAILLHQLDSRGPLHSLRFHSLKVRNTYEEWRRKEVESDELERALRGFRDFLQRDNRFATPFRQSYLDLIWFIQKMMRYGEKRGLSKAQLQAELEKRQPVTRDWVVAKIDELP